MRKRILITGGTGFIGKNIKHSFLSELYDCSFPTRSELDLLNEGSVDSYFKNRDFDVVIHAGCKPGHRNSIDRSNLFYANSKMFFNLEKHKDKYGKFINFGSGAIFDNSKDITNVKEDDALLSNPSDEHGFCKYVIQRTISNLPNFIDLNIFGIFGEFEDYSIRFISNAICKKLFGLPITLRQNRRFSYIDVRDLIGLLPKLIEADLMHKSYNVVGDQYVELKELAEFINLNFGEESKVVIAKDGYGLDYYGSNLRLQQEVGFETTPIENSITRLYNYYLENKEKLNLKELLIDK